MDGDPPLLTELVGYDESRSHYAPGVEFHIGRIELVTATGTYIDSPAHRYRGAIDVSGLALDAIANVQGLVITTHDTAIEPGAVAHHNVRGRAVLFRTGWDARWGTDRYGSIAHPYVTADCARALVDMGATIVGIDTVNIDDHSERSGGRRPVHSQLLAAGIPIVENMCGLDQLVDSAFRFFAVPVKIQGAVSFPVRAFAITE